jgi:aerobic carbon-monoxide dehydrogenase small subunit
MEHTQFTERQVIRCRVNRQEVEREVEVRKLLADFIREDLGLTATHLGCEHGVCGACTVNLNGESVRSCLLFAVQADGGELLTVEGLAKDGQMHPLQQSFWDHHALQCGFCTSGFLMSAYDLLQKNPKPTEEEVRHGLSGNLCRCTGYANIVRAVLAVAEGRE